MNNPLILVTNDDGVESPGLLAATRAVMSLGTVIIAAPTTQQTARGRSLVGNRSDWFHPTTLLPGVEAFHLDASPALVVRHALSVLFTERKPDLVVSGINYGENLGSNITISGTVGAAFQAASMGIPALAVSRQTDIEHHYSYSDLDWNDAERVTRKFAEQLLRIHKNSAPEQVSFDVLKVDVPAHCPEETEERITKLSRRHYFQSVVPEPHRERRLEEAKIRINVEKERLDPKDDIYALAVDGVVSVTPLVLNCSTTVDPELILG